MAKKPEFDPNSMLCTTCDKQVVKDKEGNWRHSRESGKNHDVTKVIKYSDWAEKLANLRKINVKDTKKPGKKSNSAGFKPISEITTEDIAKNGKKGERRGPVRLPDDQVKPESLRKRARRDAERALTYEERVKKEKDRKEAAKKREKAKQEGPALLPDLHYSKADGVHYPRADSTKAVVNVKTRDIVVPKTGEIRGKFSGVIPGIDKDSPKVAAGKEHLNTHPEHAWETAVDSSNLEATGRPIPLISPGGEGGKASPMHADYNGMLQWAHDHKEMFDKSDRYEYALVRPKPGVFEAIKNAIVTKHDAIHNPNRWIVKRRLKYCTDCAPKIFSLTTLKETKNKLQSVTRPEPAELPAVGKVKEETGNEGTQGRQSVSSARRELGLKRPSKRIPGPKGNLSTWSDSRTTGFTRGQGEGR